MKLTRDEKDAIKDLHLKGYSVREIARDILGRESRKSTVTDYLRNLKDKTPTNKAKILLFDLETSPSLAMVWKRFDVNISQDQVLSESFILTYSAKWLDDESVMFGALTFDEVKEENDQRLVRELYDLLDRADLVIGHNVNQFDVKVVNTRMIFHGFNPPSPYRTIDTLQMARSKFKFPSNKLGSLCEYLGLETKVETGGFKLWRGYMFGDKESIEKMIEYNINDTIILEQLYLKLRAWGKTHPNLQVFNNESFDILCPCCASDDIDKTDKLFTTNLSAFETYQCNSCGKWFRGRTNMLLNRETIKAGI